MKQKLWFAILTDLAYCIDKELYKAIDYLREQVRILVEQQEKQNKRIMLTNSPRMRAAAEAKRDATIYFSNPKPKPPRPHHLPRAPRLAGSYGVVIVR